MKLTLKSAGIIAGITITITFLINPILSIFWENLIFSICAGTLVALTCGLIYYACGSLASVCGAAIDLDSRNEYELIPFGKNNDIIIAFKDIEKVECLTMIEDIIIPIFLKCAYDEIELKPTSGIKGPTLLSIKYTWKNPIVQFFCSPDIDPSYIILIPEEDEIEVIDEIKEEAENDE